MPHMTAIKRQRARELRRDMTPAEAILWQYLRAHRTDGLHFRRQHVIRGFIVDFFCDTARLIVEVDGPIHDQQPDADAERDAILTGAGYRVLRITNDDICSHLDDVLQRIRQHCTPP